jgi:hypothetical protein
MASNSKIEWCDHTVNLWMGCSKVHTGCKNCYAEYFSSHRFKQNLWGEKNTRFEIKSIIDRINVRVDMTCEGWRLSSKRQPSLIEFSEILWIAINSEPFVFNFKLKKMSNEILATIKIFKKIYKISYSIENTNLK